jgi:hypothetical protein
MELSSFAETTLQFINSTSGHIFLTGKAGTGKTTFLKNLPNLTHKTLAVVAPTGIAALNAGGVTIHSQFLLPLGTFLPDKSIPTDFNGDEGFYTQTTLARKHPLNSIRKQVLRAIDLLVIDEVSMLRADILDAIDYRLKSVRGNFSRSFGGVQLLLIGDLFQLPPVVRRNEEQLLQRFYSSAWFYESIALKQERFVYVELDKIFRQQDDVFIGILNNLRNNTPTEWDIEELNKHYHTEEEIKNLDEVIILTTHNYKADEMNRNALRDLDPTSHFFEAQIEGDFPESMFPVLQRLELKEGAQIMFIRNDSEDQMYFNGKLATVKNIEGDSIEVMLAESHSIIELKREKWENKKYTINKDTNDIDDEVVGSFSQFPVRLAWAITVHKSQGLTFDKAIIDVGQAFTGGQVYVALSRLTSLDGLFLRSHIDPKVISADRQVVSFSRDSNKPEELPAIMKQKQSEFISQLIDQTFDFSGLSKEISYINRNKKESVSLKETSMQPVLEKIAIAIEGERNNTITFRKQLHFLVRSNDHEKLLERIRKGSGYYRKFLIDHLKVMLIHAQEMKQHKRVKTYLNSLSELDQLFSKTLLEVDKSLSLIEGILKRESSFEFSALIKRIAEDRARLLAEIEKEFPNSKKASSGSGKKGGRKKGDPSTYDITLKMWGNGMPIKTIAAERGLVPGTIEGHLAKAVQTGKLDINQFMAQDEIDLISKAIAEMPSGFSSKDLYIKLDGQYSYARLRVVMDIAKTDV